MANHTHLRSQSDVTNPNSMSTPNMSMPTGYTALSSSPMRLSSPTIRTHASSSIRSFPFFSTGGSTVAPSLRPMSPPPISMHRDASEAVVEPFRLTPTSNHNPDRKQADGAYPVYDSPNAPPTVRMTVRGSTTTTTQGGRTRFNPPAYTEQTKGSPETGASSRPSPAALGQLHGKKGSADTLQSVTSGGSAPRVGGSNPARGNVVYSMAPSKNPQMNSHVASASSSANAITGHRRQQSGDTNSDTGRKGRADTDENFSARDIAWFAFGYFWKLWQCKPPPPPPLFLLAYANTTLPRCYCGLNDLTMIGFEWFTICQVFVLVTFFFTPVCPR